METNSEKIGEKDLGKRWTPKLAEAKFTPIPKAFLDYYGDLYPKITSAEAIFIVHLLSFKWDERLPFPGFKTIAKYTSPE